jgi:hypothetical protein
LCTVEIETPVWRQQRPPSNDSAFQPGADREAQTRQREGAAMDERARMQQNALDQMNLDEENRRRMAEDRRRLEEHHRAENEARERANEIRRQQQEQWEAEERRRRAA